MSIIGLVEIFLKTFLKGFLLGNGIFFAENFLFFSGIGRLLPLRMAGASRL